MALQVCVDALIYWAGAVFTQRNDATIKQDATIAEAKPFVASLAAAYATKASTWKNWSCTLNGYYDDSDNTVQNAISNGTVAQLVVYPTRTNTTNYWYGQAVVKSSEQGINPNDYSTMNCEMDGSGQLTWINA